MKAHYVFADLVKACERAIDGLPPCGHGTRGYTYAVTDASQLVKIGHTFDLPSRLRAIQASNGSRVAIVGLCHDVRVETLLHGRYRDEHSHGEWFAIDRRNPLPATVDGTGRRTCYGCTDDNFTRDDLLWLRRPQPKKETHGVTKTGAYGVTPGHTRS